VQVGDVGWCVASRADVTDRLAALESHAVSDSLGVAIEVPVHKDEALGRVGGVDHQATRFAAEELENATRRCRDDRRAAWRGDVDRIVLPRSAAARRVKGAAQLRGHDAGHRHNQAGG
jgi:hypothetical protein